MSYGIFAADFQPHRLLKNPHLQTMWQTLFRPLPLLELKLECWNLPDDDYVNLAWFGQPENGKPLAVLVHGLTGGFDSKYLRGTAQQLIKAGWAGVILQLRGAGPQPNRLPGAYHQGHTQDVHALLLRLSEHYPHSKRAVVGWSLGGNISLKSAGETGADYGADYVVAISVPFELQPCAERMREGFSRVYQKRLLRSLYETVEHKQAAMSLPSQVDVSAAKSAADFFIFDDAWTAPLNGFDSALDYYQRSSCGQYLAGIAKPCLIVHSLDDPFMRPDIVPAAELLSDMVRLELCQHGGHVGFVTAAASGIGVDYWQEQRVVAWLNEQLAA